MLKFIKSSFEKVKNALGKTSSLIGCKLRDLFSAQIDEETFEKLEKILYEADLGPKLARQLAQSVKENYKSHSTMTQELALTHLKQELLRLLNKNNPLPSNEEFQPLVILIVGVNGNGKTTSIAKLAKLYLANDKKVLIAAADTFRAAAIEQLQTWAKRAGADIVIGKPGSDPSAVVFDALAAAKARKAEVVLIDTAGRLHTKTPLMQELQKIKRVCSKVIDHAPHETLLVLDATTGQNAIDQALAFHESTPLTGLILTKLDGTAKGGVALAIQDRVSLPIRFIGTGEGIDDLQAFDPEVFINALFEDPSFTGVN